MIRMLLCNSRRTLTMMTKDKALLIGWAGVIVGVATGFRLVHTRPNDDVITSDVFILGFGGIALFILLNRRISDGYRAVYALAFFIFSILPGWQFLAPAGILFLASALRRYFRRT